MSKLLDLIKNEPAIVISVVAAGAGFGATQLHLSPTDTKAAESAVTVLAGILIRQFVSPTSSVAQNMAQMDSRLKTLEALANPLIPSADSAAVQEIEQAVDSAATETRVAVGGDLAGVVHPTATAPAAASTILGTGSGWRLL